MGKGDKKSKKGKRFKGSFGNSRKRASLEKRAKRITTVKTIVAPVEVVEEKIKVKRTKKKE